MRRKDRELNDREALRSLLERGQVCHLALADGDAPYVVPMNYGFLMQEDGALALYFHSARAGKKLELLREHPHAGFAVSLSGALITGDRACDWSMTYASILGKGILTEVADEEERERGVTLLMRHHGRTEDFTYDPRVMARTVILKLAVSSYTGKSNEPKA